MTYTHKITPFYGDNAMKQKTIKFADNVECPMDLIVCAKYIQTHILDMYKQFMGITYMPKINIEFQRAKTMGTVFGYIAEPKSTNIIINCDLLLAYPENVLSRIYHEFTHVLDDYTFFKANTINNKGGLKIYSEFHATLIELMAATGFVNQKSAKQLTTNSEIIAPTKRTTIEAYYASEMTSAQRTINKCSVPLEQEKFTRLKNYAYYYMAKIYFLKKYVKNYNKEMYSLNIYSDVLGDEITSMYKILTTTSPSDIMFKCLGDLNSTMSLRHMQAAKMYNT